MSAELLSLDRGGGVNSESEHDGKQTPSDFFLTASTVLSCTKALNMRDMA